MAGRNPLAQWQDYDRGISPGRSGSVSSFGDRSVQFDDQSLVGDVEGISETTGRDGGSMKPRRRRSSISRQLGAVVDIGGANSIRSFTRSWARAAGFQEVIPQRPAFVFTPDQNPAPADGIQYRRVSDIEAGRHPRTSLLGQSLGQNPYFPQSPTGTGPSTPAMAGWPASPSQHDPLLSPLRPAPSHGPTMDFRERERKALESELGGMMSPGGSPGRSLFAMAPHLASPPVGSFSSFQSYGTMGSRASRATMIAAGPLWMQQQEAEAASDEVEPILVKDVGQDGKFVLAVEGQSTLPQTVFNSINVLIGVGLLSLPMGLKYSGWIPGMITLLLAAIVTAHTAKLLSKCMDLDASLITFSDIAYISFGSNARLATSILFSMELMAACVALIVLFADSLSLLFPGVMTVVQWKIVCAVMLMPLNFLPLRLLSYTSILGIVCCAGIVLIVVVDGFLKPATPGSLLEPAATGLWPDNWLTLPLSFGLLMSPWGAHSVFPNIYRDMRHPHKYDRAIRYTYVFSYLLDTIMAVAGLLMFGDDVSDEITSSILLTGGYPKTLTFLMCLFVAIIPLTKIPLNARPIVSTVEILAGLHVPPAADEHPSVMWWKGVARVAIRVSTILCFLFLAIVFPAFDSIMAFMGSALCFSICVVFPVAFYLKLFGHEISLRERINCWILIVVSSILCVVGTVWSLLPKHLIGAE